KRKNSKYLFMGIILLSLMYVISHLPLFYSFFADVNFVSHRIEFFKQGESVLSVIKWIIKENTKNSNDILYTYTHNFSLHKYILLTLCISILFMVKNKMKDRRLIFILSFILLSYVPILIYKWDLFSNIVISINKVLPLDFVRITWLFPPLWYIVFAISLYYIHKMSKKGIYLCIVIILVQSVVLCKKQPYHIFQHESSYSHFFAKKQFDDIKKTIGRDASSYKIINIYLPPAISQYNGFYTLDGYSTNYPLAYKHKFRKIMEKELDKHPYNKFFFDTWGSWCYILPSEIYAWWLLNSYDNDLPSIQHLDLDYNLIKEMNGQYIISSTEINTDYNSRLRLMKIFDNYETSHWTIYLYEII
ncbi:DUF6044 family protein, partial [Dysgonomonas sp. 511]|uniref:DUF6044 family protein n=1 Tax=Dysgonomonas sp. 511 TaxID=2302930 RepID=UPI001C888B92